MIINIFTILIKGIDIATISFTSTNFPSLGRRIELAI